MDAIPEELDKQHVQQGTELEELQSLETDFLSFVLPWLKLVPPGNEQMTNKVIARAYFLMG